MAVITRASGDAMVSRLDGARATPLGSVVARAFARREFLRAADATRACV